MTKKITINNNTIKNVSDTYSNEILRNIYDEVLKISETIARLDKKLVDIHFPPATERVNSSVINARTTKTPRVPKVIDRAARQEEMARVNAFPDSMGTRSIMAILPEARIGFKPSKSNRTPSTTARINALINFLLKSRSASAVDVIHPDITKKYRLKLRNITRLVRGQMIMEGVTTNSWSQLSDTEQKYYTLLLEGEVNDSLDLPIYKCKKQWAANLLLQEKMKGERQNKKRRRENPIEQSSEGSEDLAESPPVVDPRVKLEDQS